MLNVQNLIFLTTSAIKADKTKTASTNVCNIHL